MIVQELIDQLKLMNPEAVVVLQNDQEGNGYQDIRGAEDRHVIWRYGRDIEVHSLDLSAEEHDMDEEEWEETKHGPECVILYP